MAPPTYGWRGFVSRFRWQAGEHVTILGHTGSGKSELARRLLNGRRWTVVLGTKPRDETLDRYVDDGYERLARWPPEPHVTQAILWPRIRDRSDLASLAPLFADALDDIFISGVWTVAIDELHYATGRLGLEPHLSDLWEQGRSLGVSLMTATQRPANVPLLAYSQATHLFFARTTDDRDLSRLAEIGGGTDKAMLRDTVRKLPRFAYCYVNTRTGSMSITRAPAPER